MLREEKETYKKYSNLTLLKPKADQLLAMEVLAARPEPAKDFIDAYILCRDLNVKTREELLDRFFNYVDEDTALNQLLELLKYKDKHFIDSLNKQPVNLDLCNSEELAYLTITSAIIDYYLQTNDIEVPGWLRDDRLEFDRPYYHSKRLSDFEKVKLQYTSTGPFRARNVYFDLDGLIRI